MRARNFILLGWLLALAFAGSASAAVSWQPAETLDLVRGVPRPDVGINAAGSSIVVYSSADTVFDEPRPWFAVRPPGGGFTVKAVKPGGQTDARVAVAPNGATAIAAVDRGRLFVTLYPAPGAAGIPGVGGTDGTPTVIDAGGLAIDALQLAIDGSGGATVVWASPRVGQLGEPPTQVYTATVATPSWAPGSAQALGAPGRCRPAVDVNLRGDTVVSRNCTGQPDDFFYRPAGGAFGASEAPFGGGEPAPGDGRIGMALDGGGSVHAFQALYADDPKGGFHLERVSYAVRPPGGPFGIAEQLAFASPLAFDLEAQEDGDVVAAWGRSYAFRPPGGSFGPVRTVAATAAATGFDLVTSPNGPALLSWREQLGLGEARTEQVAAAAIAASGAAKPSRLGVRGVLGGSLSSPVSFAINDAGHGVGAWEQRCSRAGAAAVMAVALDDRGSAEQPPCQDRRAPKVILPGRRAGVAGRTLRVRIACDERCRMTAKARVTQRGTRRPLAGAKTARERSIAGRRGAWLKLRLSRSEAGAIRRALGAGRKVTLRLAVRVRDRYGNGAVRRFAARLPR